MKELVEILRQEQEALIALSEFAEQKQKALIHRKKDELDECIKYEQAAINKVKRIENLRLKEIQSIYESAGIEPQNFKLNLLVETLRDKMSDKEIKYFTAVEKNIKSLVGEITEINRNNMFLIRHSMQFIDKLVKQVIGEQKRKILDRRV